MARLTKAEYILRPDYFRPRINKDGYKQVQRPDWYKSLYRGPISEHILVACQVSGFDSLPKGCHVHHINCDKSNNDPSNLIIVSNSVHGLIHQQMRKVRVKV